MKIKGNDASVWRVVRLKMRQQANGKCSRCGKKVSKGEIHHKNGCPLDNRLENLEYLCGICHGLTRRNNVRQGNLPLIDHFPLRLASNAGLEEIKKEWSLNGISSSYEKDNS